MAARPALLLTLGCAAALWGCTGWVTAFNECNPDKGALLGRTTVELDVRRFTVRSGEAPVGNLVADALLETAQQGCQGGAYPCPVAAVENAGGIRNTTACGDRDAIPLGSVYAADVTDLLPFSQNQLVVVEVTGEEIVLMLERAVSILGQVGEAGAAGFFLQVSGLAFEVDCSQPAQSLSPNRDRILSRGSRVDPARVTIQGSPLSLTQTYPVAMNSFLAGAGDGFLALAVRNPDDSVVNGENGRPQTKPRSFTQLDGVRQSDADATTRYVRERAVVAPRIEGRIRLLASCIPSR
jgi:2',3'-cyclic-nucleotide 2'-phosphodiesterase (5'-nucleotidase family)